MSKVSVFARLQAKPGERGAMLDALKSLVDAADDEPGTLVYAFHEAADDDNVVWAYELYEDQAAFDAHSQSPAMAELIGKIGGLVGAAPELNVANPVMASGLDI